MKGRYWSVVGAMPFGLLLKVVGAALNFLAVPIALKVLGETTYAAFTAILGFAGWLALGSFGIGNLTAMTVADHAHNEQKHREDFWQAATSNFLSVAIAALVFIYPFYLFISHLAQGIPQVERLFLHLSAYYCFAAILVSAMSVSFEGRYVGLLRARYCYVVRTIGQVLALVLLLGLVPLFPNMLSVTIAMTVGSLAASVWFIVRGSYDCPPPLHFRYDLRSSIPLLLHGGAYLAVALAVLFYGGGNLPLFAIVFGREELATAGVMAKTVQLYFSVTSIFVVPLAAAIKHATVAGDHAWTQKSLLDLSILIVAGGCFVAIVFCLFGVSLFKLWTGVELPALKTWILPMAVMIAVTGWYHFWIYVCFAFEGAAPVAVCAFFEVTTITVAFIVFGAFVSPATSLWITAAAMLTFSGTILPIRVFRHFRKT